MSFEEIAEMSRESLRKLLREKMTDITYEELMEEKDRLKRLNGLVYKKLELQPYLSSPDLTMRQKQLIFKWRSRMVKVGWNYGAKNLCPLCSVADDTQEHILSCPKLCSDCMTDDSDVNINNLEQHIKIIETAIRSREIALDEQTNKNK